MSWKHPIFHVPGWRHGNLRVLPQCHLIKGLLTVGFPWGRKLPPCFAPSSNPLNEEGTLLGAWNLRGKPSENWTPGPFWCGCPSGQFLLQGSKKKTRVVGMFCEELLASLYGKCIYEDTKSATVVAVGSPWTKNGSQLIRPLISLFRTDRTNSAKQDDISHWAQPPHRPLAAG